MFWIRPVDVKPQFLVLTQIHNRINHLFHLLKGQKPQTNFSSYWGHLGFQLFSDDTEPAQMCQIGNLGGYQHLVFECPALQVIRGRYGDLSGDYDDTVVIHLAVLYSCNCANYQGMYNKR